MIRLFRLSITGGLLWGDIHYPNRVWTVYLRWPIKVDFYSSALAPEQKPLTVDTIDLTNPLPGDPPKAGDA